MYTPKHFSEQDKEALQAFIQQFPLATMVCASADGLEAHHIPLLWENEGDTAFLIGHFAKANRVWEQANATWLVIFAEGGQYISPNWYPSKAVTHREVPTWNFRAVHIRGELQIVDDIAQKLDILDKLTQHFEQHLPTPWQIFDAPNEYLQSMSKAVVTFKFVVHDIQGKFKLSQNKTPENIAGVVAGLQKFQPNTLMAQVMTDYYDNHGKNL